MKHHLSVTIRQSQQKVIDAYLESYSLKKFLPLFDKRILIAGQNNQTSAVSEIHFRSKEGNHHFLETVVSNELPHSFEVQNHSHYLYIVTCIKIVVYR